MNINIILEFIAGIKIKFYICTSDFGFTSPIWNLCGHSALLPYTLLWGP